MLRRLEKRVLVDLPTKEARKAMFEQFLPPTVIRETSGLVLFSDLDYGRLGEVKALMIFLIFHKKFSMRKFYVCFTVYRWLFRCRHQTCL